MRSRRMILAGLGGAAAVFAAVTLNSCAGPGAKQGIVDSPRRTEVEAPVTADVTTRAELDAALVQFRKDIDAKIDARIETKMDARIDTKIETRIAPKIEAHDSFTSWLLAIGMGVTLILSTPAGGMFYQHVLRPRRIVAEQQRRREAGE